MPITTREYLDTLREAVLTGKECSMLITGNSMQPFLQHGRDTIYFRAPSRPLKRGDMVFFRRPDGQYVMHRLLREDTAGYYLIGDNQTEIEGPVDRTSAFAIVYKVKRKGRILAPGSFWWGFFAGFWLSIIPLRPFLLKVYRTLKFTPPPV